MIGPESMSALGYGSREAGPMVASVATSFRQLNGQE